jgi:imidazolonepropionase-like amidohydrolase
MACSCGCGHHRTRVNDRRRVHRNDARTRGCALPALTLQEYLGSGEADPPLSAEAAQVHSGHANAIRLAHEASVRIFAGTDPCNTMAFGRHARQLQLLVDVVGMTPMQALVAATRSGAEALGSTR